MSGNRLRWRFVAPIALGIALLAGCGSEQVQATSGADESLEQSAAVGEVVAAPTTEAPTTEPPTTEPLADEDPIEAEPIGEPEEQSSELVAASWLDGVDAEVVATESWLESSFQLWLLRLDDSQARDFGTALGTEAVRLGVTDEEGVLAQLATGNWLGGDAPQQLLSIDFALNGGLFGEYNPEPIGPNGETVLFGLIPGDLGQEPPDQIEYHLGSSPRIALAPGWEQLIVELLPDLSTSESLVAVAIAG